MYLDASAWRYVHMSRVYVSDIIIIIISYQHDPHETQKPLTAYRYRVQTLTELNSGDISLL